MKTTKPVLEAEVVDNQITLKNQDQCEQVFETIYDEFSAKVDNESVEDFLASYLEKQNVYSATEGRAVVKEISDTIDLIDDKYQSLQQAKRNGDSSAAWLKSELEKTVTNYRIENPNLLLDAVYDGLSKCNKETFEVLYNQDYKLSKPDFSLLKNTEIIDKKMVQNVTNEIKNNTILSAVTVDGLNFKLDSKHKDIKAVKEYFERELHHPKDKEISKVAATGLVEIREKKWMPFLKGKSNAELATIADKGILFSKVAYKVVKGELNPTIATDIIIDRTTAAVSGIVTKTCATVGSKVGGVIGGTIGSIFGPGGTAVGAAVGTFVGKLAGTGVGIAVSKGIQKVGEVAKKTASKIWEGTKVVAKSIGSSISSGLKSLFSW